jgi:hypothetical protein
VLVAGYTSPRPDRDSGSRRLDGMLGILLEDGWSVTFVTTRPDKESGYPEALRRRGIGVFHLTPDDVADLAATVRFDLAILSFWPTAELFVPPLRRASPSTPVVVDSVDLHFVRHARRITQLMGEEGLRDAAYLDQVRAELDAYVAADLVLTVSRREAELLEVRLGEPGLCWVVPDQEAVPHTTVPLEDRRGILFVGSFEHPPNRDAVAFLCREVVPRLPPGLTERHPVMIIGNGLDAEIRAMAREESSVGVVGWVPTAEPWFGSARVSVLPLLSGAGTKRELVQSLMAGTPAVTTMIGAEGLDLEDERQILVRDTPGAFAHAIATLVGDDAMWSRLSADGKVAMARLHGPERAQEAFRVVIANALRRPPKGPILPFVDGDQHLARLGYQHEQRRVGSATVTLTPRLEPAGPDSDPNVRLIAFLLPQFHRIPENDAWWGEGFTEWSLVRSATPRFSGHRQPREPGELGYYDLLDPEVRERQAELARAHGIHGFCWYHYWFGGKRLLERPFDEVLASGSPDLPFALCWANEPWSRRWDGSEQEVLQPQAYGRADYLEHIRWLLPALADPRAIRVGRQPLLLVYQGHALPEPARLTDIWRTEVARAGLAGLYLLAVETGLDAGWNATSVGFDGKVRFQPQFSVVQQVPRLEIPGSPELHVHDYGATWPVLSDLPDVPYPVYETVTPAWDNTPRRREGGWVLHGSTPELYERWLKQALDRACSRPPDQRLVFLNAWNEWSEGAYLEPDTTHGRGYLEATLRAICATRERPAVMLADRAPRR